MSQREFAIEIVRRLHAAGHEAVFAGGCVRDQLLGIPPKDYDVATSALPEQVRALFGKRRTLALGAAFGVITVLGPGQRDPIEVATFRTDGKYYDGRRPDDVQYTTAEADAQRRDFTINGMFFDPEADRVVDYVGGQADLQQGVVRAIGDADARFSEDKLRMLRAVRFACTYDFTIEPETVAAIVKMANTVTIVSAERIGAELQRTLSHPNRRRGVELLHETGLLGPLLPEVADLAAAAGSAWSQTLGRIARLGESTFPAALAALLADRGETVDVSALCRRLRWTNNTAKRTAWLLGSLPLINQAEQAPWPQLQRLLVAPGIDELLAIAEAERPLSHAGLERCRTALALPPERLNPPPLVTGDDLIAAGLPAGKHFAALLKHLRDRQLEGELTTAPAALRAAHNWMEHRKP